MTSRKEKALGQGLDVLHQLKMKNEKAQPPEETGNPSFSQDQKSAHRVPTGDLLKPQTQLSRQEIDLRSFKLRQLVHLELDDEALLENLQKPAKNCDEGSSQLNQLLFLAKSACSVHEIFNLFYRQMARHWPSKSNDWPRQLLIILEGLVERAQELAARIEPEDPFRQKLRRQEAGLELIRGALAYFCTFAAYEAKKKKPKRTFRGGNHHG